MASKRKGLSKKIRFEVFKRDKFTCQYCGRMSPDIVLEVDHIKPVSKGGNNDIMNLVTSCRDCNRGKGKTELSDDSVIKKQQRQLQELAEKQEQLEMMITWQQSLSDFKTIETAKIADYFEEETSFVLTEHGFNKLKKIISNYSVKEVLDAIDIAIDKYFDGSSESASFCIEKISGICNNRRIQEDDKRPYYFNYLKKCCNNMFGYCNKNALRDYVYGNILDEEDFIAAKELLYHARNWTQYYNNLIDRGEDIERD